MKLKSITFQSYKAFNSAQFLEVRPITILIGKNSSGKSAIAKLFPLLEKSLSLEIEEPLYVINNDVELGGEFIDLVYGKQPNVPLAFTIKYEKDTELSVSILQEIGKFNLTIFEWGIKIKDNELKLKYSPEINKYLDAGGKVYQCNFRGITPIEIIDEKGDNIVREFFTDLKINVDYIGPFRILPQRQFYLSGQIDFVNTGVKGEHAYSMLGISKIMKTELHEKVGKWYENHFDGWKLEVKDSNRPFIELLLAKNDTEVNIVDVGQGMNQALPLIVRANVGKSDSIIVIEQPELHLHPAAHGDLMELFAESALTNVQSFIIETHSENMILRLRKLVLENKFKFSHSDVIIYWVSDAESGGQELTEITIDENGVLSNWPEGVFHENITEILEMQKALNKKTS